MFDCKENRYFKWIYCRELRFCLHWLIWFQQFASLEIHNCNLWHLGKELYYYPVYLLDLFFCYFTGEIFVHFSIIYRREKYSAGSSVRNVIEPKDLGMQSDCDDACNWDDKENNYDWSCSSTFFIVAGTLWGIVETFKYRKNFSRDCENGQISTIKAYRIKRRGSWRIFGDRILDEKSFLVMREKESKVKKIH